MELKKCLPFCLHASIVCCGLALEEFFPAARTMICSPLLHDLIHHDKPKPDNLTAQTGLNIGLEPIIDRIEEKYLPDRDWGDFPENLQRDLG
jgi:hypothetical protein